MGCRNNVRDVSESSGGHGDSMEVFLGQGTSEGRPSSERCLWRQPEMVEDGYRASGLVADEDD